MALDSNESTEENLDDIELYEEITSSMPHEYIRIDVSSMRKRSLGDRNRTKRLLDFLEASVYKAFSVFRPTVDQREEVSVSVPSRVSVRRHFHTNFIKKLNLASLLSIFKNWIKHPVNAALLLWLICVAISSTMLALLLLGLLNKAFPTKTSRNRWIETNNQLLNALFTLMSLYQHPNLFHHLILLLRWRSPDIVQLRMIYSKNGSYRPREWAHMMLVVVLLHITCFSQYVSCGLIWGYSSDLRPEFLETISFALGTIAPLIAGLYSVYSPLGRGFGADTEPEELKEVTVSNKCVDVIIETERKWNGGLFDCNGDKNVGCLSFFCTFCVFGWNMERLGFGNMYVHMVTFFLLCVAPFWIFSISAMNISNDVVREVVGVLGLVLCVFGLIYGGFWRIKMREKFGLRGNSFCFGSESMTDYFQWIFCSACSLAQEVRTVGFYDDQDDSFHRRNVESDEESCKFLEKDEEFDSDVVMMAPIQHRIGSECVDSDGNFVAVSLSSASAQTK